jgi:hypothetical protein
MEAILGICIIRRPAIMRGEVGFWNFGGQSRCEDGDGDGRERTKEDAPKSRVGRNLIFSSTTPR